MVAQVTYLNTSPTIPDPKLIKGFVKKLKEGDIIGVEHNQYRVEQANKENFTVSDVKTKRECQIDEARLSMAIGMGFAEILYRKGKPYGVALEKEVTIKIHNHTKEEPSKT
jgi:hypothetical protein